MTVATGTSTLVDTILDAGVSQTGLRISGRANWMDAGRPCAATRVISLAGHSGVVDYVPGDLTITVRSGTSLFEIERIAAAEGQWLPLVPYGTADGSIGATIATGSSGPLAHAFGRARDLVLGLEFVSGDGKIVRGGGRVVKNVAGFDLVRLMTGSWGTLGVITEVSLRLYSLPSITVTLALQLGDSTALVTERIRAILRSPVTPHAVEMVDARIAGHMGLPAGGKVLVRLGGNVPGVQAQRDALAKLGVASEVPDSVWDALRRIEPSTSDEAAPPVVLRLSAVPARIGELWSAVRRSIVGVDGAMVHATPSLGIVRCMVPADTPIADVAALAGAMPGVTCVYERLNREMWQALSPSVTFDRLSQRLRRAFDPMDILNPGLLGRADSERSTEVT